MPDLEKKVAHVLRALNCLTVYRKILNDPILLSFRDVMELTLKNEPAAVGKYFSLIGILLDLQKNYRLPGIDIFKNHLLDTMLSVENSFSLACEKEEFKNIDNLIIRVAQNDLSLMKIVYDFDILLLMEHLAHKYKIGDLILPLEGLVGSENLKKDYQKYFFKNREWIKKVLSLSGEWGENIGDLHTYFRETGSGEFGRYWAFKWNSSSLNPELAGIANPDAIRIEDLVGYEDQQEQIIRNTSQFVKGFTANNMLLYGDRGTGKSSTIKSLIHIFGHKGLRIIEVSKHDLLSLHAIIQKVEGRAQKFILFIDDLSFEENETEYKDLKAILEGSIEKPPDNVLVYATSNRRNLVREFFSDRDMDEVSSQDTYQEKLSLADRFGIKLVFPTPDKWEFLKTVEDIARKSGITMEKAKLHSLAMEWVMWHNSRSGRTAKQFVNDLRGRLDLES